MSTTFTPVSPPDTPPVDGLLQPASPALRHPFFKALAAFVILAGIVLGVAIVTGATAVINIAFFALFMVLWLAFFATLVVNRSTLDDLWNETRRLHLVLQGVIWLLFLPVMIALWVWERSWSLPIRVVVTVAFGAWTLYIFFPRSL